MGDGPLKRYNHGLVDLSSDVNEVNCAGRDLPNHPKSTASPQAEARKPVVYFRLHMVTSFEFGTCRGSVSQADMTWTRLMR